MLSLTQVQAKHTLPDLPYDYSALEPVISGEIMELHHSKHHQAINFNGGGHINHSIFWENLCPVKDYRPPQGALLEKINQDFGSLEKMQANLTASTVGLQGSGWGWLGYDKQTDQLYVKTMANQDPLSCGAPLFGIDAWEHAYYLQYKNVRPDYVKAIWDIVNWKDVEQRFEAARK
ncbi:superoxide dismutase [Chloropicon primus]|nr:superoxide dismutase [Chloropicon primus]